MRGANVAFIMTSGVALMTPMQFGPIMRIPYRRTTATRSCSRLRPSSPSSLNPALMTMSPRTPASPHSVATSITRSLGTTTTARSTGSAILLTDDTAATEHTDRALGFTGYTDPVNPH
jgi:hypothetical protein